MKYNSISIITIFTIFLCSMISAKNPRLLIKMPTRSRPEKFFKVLDLYYENLSKEVEYFFLISCDKDDTSMNNNEVKGRLKKYPNLCIKFGESKSKIEAYNKDIELFLNYDIFLITSDDTLPTKGYDKRIVSLMTEHFPDFDGVIHFNDGYVGRHLNTLPVIGKKYYSRFGYIYHPSYKSLCCDNELMLVSRMLAKEKYCDEVIIRHEHPTNNTHIVYDELYKKNDEWFLADTATYLFRRKNYFFIQDQLPRLPFKLSILLTHTDLKSLMFTYNKLIQQRQALGLVNEVEILFASNSQTNCIGFKRNLLLQKSRGQYTCFIDEYIEVLPNYLSEIIKKLEKNPDCVGLAGYISESGKHLHLFFQRLKYKLRKIERNNLFQPVNHLNPMKREIAVQFTFSEVEKLNSDFWSKTLYDSELLKTEAFLDQPIIRITKLAAMSGDFK